MAPATLDCCLTGFFCQRLQISRSTCLSVQRTGCNWRYQIGSRSVLNTAPRHNSAACAMVDSVLSKMGVNSIESEVYTSADNVIVKRNVVAMGVCETGRDRNAPDRKVTFALQFNTKIFNFRRPV